jgi:cytochrome c biogenesis protein CcmG, thiol:disulfide interchange protein DsbE
MKLRFILPLLVSVGLAALLYAGLSTDPHHLPSALIDKPMPALRLRSLEGDLLTRQELKGKVSLLNVWATWCVACRADHEILMQIASEKIVPIYGIDYQDDWKAAKQLLQTYGNPYQKIGLDQDGRTSIDWGVYGTPETFLIDKTGIIRYKHMGPLTAEEWHDTLKPLVQKLQSEA